MSTPPPPPPPSGSIRPPPPPAYGAPTWSAPVPPPPSAGWTGAPTKPPRPAVPVAGWLLLGGAALAVLGTLLNWYSFDGEDVNGFTEVASDDGGRDGPVFVVFAVILAGFGITLLAAKRVLAVAILAVIFASFVVLAGFADLSDLIDRADLVEAFGGEVDIGPGIPVVIVGGLVALAGGIVALATRRR